MAHAMPLVLRGPSVAGGQLRAQRRRAGAGRRCSATGLHVNTGQGADRGRELILDGKRELLAMSGDAGMNAMGLGNMVPPSMRSGAPAQVGASGGPSTPRPRTPPPDLPSLLLDSRIVYVGMPLVPSVTELVIAELLYLQYNEPSKPVYMYINSTGCSRADGETVAMETEAFAIYDTMQYCVARRGRGAELNTVCCGVAIGQSAMLLSAGVKGYRYSLPNCTMMLHQPRTPPKGRMQASDVEIQWREIAEQDRISIELLNTHTGRSKEQIARDISRPFYMTPEKALAYGLIDSILDKKAMESVSKPEDWDKAAGLRVVQRPQQGPGM